MSFLGNALIKIGHMLKGSAQTPDRNTVLSTAQTPTTEAPSLATPTGTTGAAPVPQKKLILPRIGLIASPFVQQQIDRAAAEADKTARAKAIMRGFFAPYFFKILPHSAALKIRRSQLLTKDHYGNMVADDWRREIEYFIRRNLLDDDLEAFERFESESGSQTYFRIKNLVDFCALNAHRLESGRDEDEGLDQCEWEKLDALEFETNCRERLIAIGWLARTTAGSGDQGIDIIANYGDEKLVVQCKRYKGSVGNKAVQEIIAGRTFERADLAAVVSTGQFTKSAKQLAASANVTLLHPAQLAVAYARRPVTSPSSFAKVTPDEMLADFIERTYNPSIDLRPQEDDTGDGDMGDDEELFQQALDVLRSTKRASTSMIQRRLRIGYNRAAHIMDLMEDRGIIGPENGSSPREILKDLDTL